MITVDYEYTKFKIFGTMKKSISRDTAYNCGRAGLWLSRVFGSRNPRGLVYKERLLSDVVVEGCLGHRNHKMIELLGL